MRVSKSKLTSGRLESGERRDFGIVHSRRATFGVKDKDKLKSHGTIFTPIPVRIVTYDEEKAASKERTFTRLEAAG
jgi:hypothetical protein